MDFAFILKKIVSAFVMPFSISFIVLFIGLIYLYIKNYKKAKWFLSIGVVLITLISYNPVSYLMLMPLENKYQAPKNIPKDLKYVLLLGGDMNNRAWEVLKLYKIKSDLNIITSGYKGSRKISEALKTANLFYSLGIEKNKIIIHDKPKDTKEEAKYIKKLLGKKEFLLVSSAYHMPRAMAIFKKKGLNPIAYPTDFKTKNGFKVFSIPSGKNISRTQMAWHEYLGLLWAKLKGDI